MYVTPAPGLTIPDPDLQDVLPATGREVPDTPYWQRRIFDRDVLVKAAAAEKPARSTGSNKE